uniref:deoxynucleoside triphosphate triphosphohydrolase SAMHD1-like n=1 Tax=Styela clava TaxID=7725 RepID=UPI00193A3DDA|nr:deoxynucleoside triphosphate triphosphohydrolase SAMHD1-like [Styela clava]
MNETVFNDPVHGTISLRPELVKIINTPQFQRLRNIKQLSGKYFVYPGVSHNRFEHSIGTAYLAGKLVRHLKKNQDLGIDERDVLCVEIAGLCHDLGHGPFSHLFDGMFMKKLKKRESEEERVENEKYLSHEDISCKMLDLLLDGIEEKIVSEEERQFIKEMIAGSGKGCTSDRWFLYEIISNKTNGVDVDKWDYFARDCHHLGIPNGFNHNRFLQFMQVLPVEKDDQYKEEGKHICVHEKECFNLYEMFHTRCSLHRRAYQHKAGNAIDHMISDALVEADRHILFRGKKAEPQNLDWNEARKLENGCFKLPDPDSPNRNFLKDGNDVFHLRTISQCVDDPVAYTKLDDGIFQQILHSDGEPLKKAREILERIFRRDIYRCIGDVLDCIGDEQLKEGQDVRVKEHEIKKQIVGDSNIIGVDDLEVSLVVLNYGDDDNNPVAKYRFYSKSEHQEPLKAKEIKPCEFSNMLPAKFEERRIQVFCKNPGFLQKKAIEARKRFEDWKKK